MKEKIISDLVETRRDILRVASSLPPEKQDRVFLGVWSVKDLLAHLIGWDYANIEAVQAIRAGRLPGFYDQNDHDWRTFNAHLVVKHKKDNFTELGKDLEQSNHQLIKLLKEIPANEFIRDWGIRYKGYRVTITKIIGSEVK
jgi:hypothetical protein